jgi:hypothetical protein
VLLIFKSGSMSLEKERVKTFKPLKTDKKMNKAIAPTIIPKLAIRLIILMALFLLLLKI